MKVLFSRYGVPNIVALDNGPQFSSAEFRTFATKWQFKHTTSSPYYPQLNGKAENAVKKLFTKSRDSGRSEYLALLDWHNTPTGGIRTCPAQQFLGRRRRTLLPVSAALLTSDYPMQKANQKLKGSKTTSRAYYYNHQAKTLQPLAPGH